MDALDYHRAFVAETGSGIDQRTYQTAFEAEYAALGTEYNGRPAAKREATAARLANWYRDTRRGPDEEDHNVYLLTHGEYGGQITDLQRAEALLSLVSRHRISYVLMHAAARVDACRRTHETADEAEVLR